MKPRSRLNDKCGGNTAVGLLPLPLSIFLLSFILTAGPAFQCRGQIILSNNNCQVWIDPTSSAGMYSYHIQDGYLSCHQWFWCRGATQIPINALGALAVSEFTANTVRLTYGTLPTRVSIKFTLTGGAPNTGLADLAMQMSSSVTLFQYSEFPDYGSDNVRLSRDIHTGLFNEADQTGMAAVGVRASITPGADRCETGIVPSTLNDVNYGADLNDSTYASGNVAWAWQWSSGGSINEDEVIQFAEIGSGGVVHWGASTAGAKQAGYFYLFQVACPPGAVAAGAAWRYQGVPGAGGCGCSDWYAPTGGVFVTSVPIEFGQAVGYATPGPVTINLQSSTNFQNGVQITTVPADYVLQPRPQLINVRRLSNGRFAMTLQGIANRVYSLQYCTNLGNWSLLSLLTNTASGTFTFTNSPPAGSACDFYRVKEGTN